MAGGLGAGHRDDADLLQQAEHVEADVRLRHLAVDIALDADAADDRALAGGRHTVQRAEIGISHRPTGDDAIAFGDLVFDGKSDVWEGATIERDNVLAGLWADPEAARRRIWVVICVVVGRDLVCHLEPALVEQLQAAAATDCFVVFD